ncbi:MAG TPA: serine/threonine protein kinase, partial [Gallionella sp.]|nr:serine/threonine protein kinase [Gallionella sp.]
TGQAPFNGENVNAIMYQTLNAVPAPPSTLNSAVPEMANFIVAKALAKKLEDRYQNAKDFAVDLRACRDTLPRSGKEIDVSPIGSEKKLPDAIDVSGRRDMEEEAKQGAVLSQAFDSAAATMRLAALTASSIDVDELSKTFKIARPSAEAISQAASAAKAPQLASPAISRPAVHQSRAEQLARPGGGNLMLIAVVILVLLGIAAILVA